MRALKKLVKKSKKHRKREFMTALTVDIDAAIDYAWKKGDWDHIENLILLGPWINGQLTSLNLDDTVYEIYENNSELVSIESYSTAVWDVTLRVAKVSAPYTVRILRFRTPGYIGSMQDDDPFTFLGHSEWKVASADYVYGTQRISMKTLITDSSGGVWRRTGHNDSITGHALVRSTLDVTDTGVTVDTLDTSAGPLTYEAV